MFEKLVQICMYTLYTVKLINRQTKTYLFLLIANYRLHEISIAFSSFENFPSVYIETFYTSIFWLYYYVHTFTTSTPYIMAVH